MSGINQDIKSGPFNVLDKVNPHNLFEFIKPSRILFGTVNPSLDEGTLFDYYINTATGDIFEKERDGDWVLQYNFDTGGGTGITAIENDADPGWFKNIIGNTAHFKGVTGAANQILIDSVTDPDALQFQMDPVYKPETLSLVNNFPLRIGVGGDTLDPNGLLGEDEGYNRGSIFVQIGSNDKIWLCNDPVAKVWLILAEVDDVKECVSIGSTGNDIYAETVAGVARFRKIEGASGDIFTQQTVDGRVLIGIPAAYKPDTLNLVENVKNAQGETTTPTAFDDSSIDFAVGSLWTTATQVYLCEDATVGNAVWKLVSGGGGSTAKDYINWTNSASSYVQAININFQPLTLGPTLPTLRVTQTGTDWQALDSGGIITFRRNAVTESKNYEVSFNFICEDFAGTTINEAAYDVIMTRSSGTVVISQSLCSFALPAQSVTTRRGYTSASFLLDVFSLGLEEFYFQIRGKTGPTTNAQDIDVIHWSLAIKEL